MKALKLPPRLRPVLQRPLGRLLKGSVEEIYALLRVMVDEVKPPRVVTVGDVVTADAVEHGLSIDVAIGDFKTKRTEESRLSRAAFKEVVKVHNPQGLITLEACSKIAYCLRKVGKGGGVLIEVDGEEDLLTIPCVIYAPERSAIIYGQPNEGVVVLTVSEELRAFFKSLLSVFEEVKIN